MIKKEIKSKPKTSLEYEKEIIELKQTINSMNFRLSELIQDRNKKQLELAEDEEHYQEMYDFLENLPYEVNIVLCRTQEKYFTEQD